MQLAHEFQSMALLYIYQCVQQGKIEIIEQLGIDLEAMRVIRRMPILDIQQSRQCPNIIKHIEIDLEALRAVSHKACVFQETETCIDALLHAGATYALMNNFFGLTKRDVSKRRRLLNVGMPSGRPVGLSHVRTRRTDATLIKPVIEYLNTVPSKKRGNPIQQCESLLHASRCTGRTVNLIWDVVERTATRGDFSWYGTH